MSYKGLLDIGPEEFDENDYGLVFSVDVQDNSGALRSHPLVTNGEDVVVTSDNRDKFVELRFQHNCVTLVREQTLNFLHGFEDMLSEKTPGSTFFNCIKLDDLDAMLRGSDEDNICPNQWRAHTTYEGFDANDEVIVWFWQVVDEMNNEERRCLLHFWTAVNYLPRGGFKGFLEPLIIRKTTKPADRFPKSSTCLNELTLPTYTSYVTTKIKVL